MLKSAYLFSTKGWMVMTKCRLYVPPTDEKLRVLKSFYFLDKCKLNETRIKKNRRSRFCNLGSITGLQSENAQVSKLNNFNFFFRRYGYLFNLPEPKISNYHLSVVCRFVICLVEMNTVVLE